ncbi:MAG TPA: hypothetical protein VM580_29190 [Labilithrix sp.]|nr:hypothetical protein [Labilithrix sp.]
MARGLAQDAAARAEGALTVAFCKRVADSSSFQRFVTVVILLAGVLVGLET